jgi:hypothetical protein
VTALREPVLPVVAVLPSAGWCTPCAAAGERREAADPRSGSVCRDHLRLLPPRPPLPGQLALVDVDRVPRLLQAGYETGIQVACSPCAAAGRDELGMPFRIEDDPTPLCLTCWRRREGQASRRGLAAAEPMEWVQDLPVECAACGSPDPDPGCWLCGWSWLADADAENERWLAEQQKAVDDQFARLAVREQAAARVSWLTGWVQRLRQVLAAYADPDRRGAVVSLRWGRAVELLADALARDALERAAGSARGRPSAFRMVAAVMAVDADFRSGRRAMPGRPQCAELAGVCERAVYSAWKRGVALGAWVRTTPGRRLSLAERVETGRGNDRAVYDLRPVHRSSDPAARDRMVPAALTALDELLDWGLQLLVDAERALDAHDAPQCGTGRAPAADAIATRAGRARLRQAVAATRTAAATLASHMSTANNCTPHTVSKGECVSSCLVGLSSTFVNRQNLRTRRRPRRGRGNTTSGASRSPATTACADRPDSAHPVERPRTLYRVSAPSPHSPDDPASDVTAGRTRPRRRRPGWHDWAYPLAHRLRGLWPWLRHEPLHMVAATLGARLGPQWNAGDVVDFVGQARAGRALPVDLHTPVGMLRELLEEALTGHLQPPYPARRHDEHQQQLAERRRAASVAEAAARHAAAEAARAARAAATASGAGRAAARAAAVSGEGATTRLGRLDSAAPVAAPVAWSEPVRQPGEGLPASWERRRDR